MLDALARAGVKVPSSCRAGACQSCLVQVTHGAIPERSQIGLKDSLRSQNFVLACQSIPVGDVEVSVDAAQDLEVPARIHDVVRLGEDVLRVDVRIARAIGHRAGQFVTLIRDDGLARPYSVASAADHRGGEFIELHVRVLSPGRMSQWLASEAARGANVRVRGPSGECFYVPGKSDQPLVLAGTGTGLAPLWRIARDALASGHRGPIELWHGARTPAGLYLRGELERMALEHENFSYRACVLEGAPSGADASERVGMLDELLLKSTRVFDGPRFYLCGDATLVQRLKRALCVRGASLKEIYADAFVNAPDAATRS